MSPMSRRWSPLVKTAVAVMIVVGVGLATMAAGRALVGGPLPEVATVVLAPATVPPTTTSTTTSPPPVEAPATAAEAPAPVPASVPAPAPIPAPLPGGDDDPASSSATSGATTTRPTPTSWTCTSATCGASSATASSRPSGDGLPPLGTGRRRLSPRRGVAPGVDEETLTQASPVARCARGGRLRPEGAGAR